MSFTARSGLARMPGGKQSFAAKGFAALALLVSFVSAVLAALYGWSLSASSWAAVAGGALCLLIAIVAPALEIGASLATFAGVGRAFLALILLWPAALAAEATVMWFDFNAIAARSDEMQAVRERALRVEHDRGDNIAALRRILSEDSAGLTAARAAATAAEKKRMAECADGRGQRCRDAEVTEQQANAAVLEEARRQEKARVTAHNEIGRLQVSGAGDPLIAAANPAERALRPFLGEWANRLTQLQQMWAAGLIGISRLLFIVVAAMLAKRDMAEAIIGAARAQVSPAPSVSKAEGSAVLDFASFLVPAEGAKVPIEDVRVVALRMLARMLENHAKRHGACLTDGGRCLTGLRLVKQVERV